MNIYIYGSDTFRKDIHSTLNRANIQFKLDSNTLIKDIHELGELQQTIKNNPNEIYLIDDEKIIKKNSKIKFLNPKDGIEESFLLNHGIADLSVDSLLEIPKYIIRKYEENHQTNEIQNSIINIVEEAYENEENEEIEESSKQLEEKFEEDFEEDFKLDDELATLLSKEEKEEEEVQDINLDELENIMQEQNEDNPINEEDLSKMLSFDEDVGLENSSLDYDDADSIVEENKIEIENEEDLDDLLSEISDDATPNFDSIEEKNFGDIDSQLQLQGEKMSDSFSELDSLKEEDILDALNLNKPKQIVKEDVLSHPSEIVNVSNSDTSELSELISKLLKDKTLEITIKIKD